MPAVAGSLPRGGRWRGRLGLSLALVSAWAAGAGCGPDAAREREAARERGDDGGAGSAQAVIDRYLELYFEIFPSEATAAGRRNRDSELERLDPAARARWLAANHETLREIEAVLAAPRTSEAERIDLGLLRRRAERFALDWETRREPERNPLFWSEKLSGATTFLLVRQDLPAAQRLDAAAARARALPALAAQAQAALASSPPEALAPELLARAAAQLRAAAAFYRDSFARAAGEDTDLAGDLEDAGGAAHDALAGLAAYCDERRGGAAGSPRLGERYAALLRVVAGIDEAPASLLTRAERALADKRVEAAAFGRQVWLTVMGEEPMPGGDAELLRRLFDRIGDNHARSVDEFVAEYRQLVLDAEAFVRERGLVTLPDPLTVTTDRSPEYMSGQGVGGVFPAGPYASETQTFYFVPTPSERMSAAQRGAFFRDFNHHFNVMITPHEMIPGHYLQGKVAARLGRPVRALFGDGPYTEGWGTFCERLLLDLGWGGPGDRLAHLKKQMENIARTIVDVRVHTAGMGEDEVLAFVQDEALQEGHFARNMWTRSITTAPQITFYWVGYEQHRALFEETQARLGDRFDLRRYLDTMVSLGGAPIGEYRRVLAAWR